MSETLLGLIGEWFLTCVLSAVGVALLCWAYKSRFVLQKLVLEGQDENTSALAVAAAYLAIIDTRERELTADEYGLLGRILDAQSRRAHAWILFAGIVFAAGMVTFAPFANMVLFGAPASAGAIDVVTDGAGAAAGGMEIDPVRFALGSIGTLLVVTLVVGGWFIVRGGRRQRELLAELGASERKRVALERGPDG